MVVTRKKLLCVCGGGVVCGCVCQITYFPVWRIGGSDVTDSTTAQVHFWTYILISLPRERVGALTQPSSRNISINLPLPIEIGQNIKQVVCSPHAGCLRADQ